MYKTESDRRIAGTQREGMGRRRDRETGGTYKTNMKVPTTIPTSVPPRDRIKGSDGDGFVVVYAVADSACTNRLMECIRHDMLQCIELFIVYIHWVCFRNIKRTQHLEIFHDYKTINKEICGDISFSQEC